MKFNVNAILIVPFVVASHAMAICPGFNFGIGNQQNLGNGVSRCKHISPPDFQHCDRGLK